MYPVFILVSCYVLVIHVPSLYFMSYYVLVIYVPHLYFMAYYVLVIYFMSYYVLAIEETTYIKRNGRLLNSNDYTHTTTSNLNNEKQLT